MINFSANPSTITPGLQSATLTWSTINATSVSIDNGIGQVPLSGSLQVAPSSTTTYKLTATNPAASNTAFATITVNGSANRPVINVGGVVTVMRSAQLISPLSLTSIYGRNFTNNVTQLWNGSKLTTTLAGVSVSVDGRPAYLLYVSPTLITFRSRIHLLADRWRSQSRTRTGPAISEWLRWPTSRRV